jgi:hypothetical protein
MQIILDSGRAGPGLSRDARINAFNPFLSTTPRFRDIKELETLEEDGNFDRLSGYGHRLLESNSCRNFRTMTAFGHVAAQRRGEKGGT